MTFLELPNWYNERLSPSLIVSLVHSELIASRSGVQRRFAKAMRDYCYGSIEQVHTRFWGKDPSVEEMLAMRRRSAGVAPLFALAEYVHAHPYELSDCFHVLERSF